jgi:hypothetical protein
MLFFPEENSGEVVAAYLLPTVSYYMIILYMNIIEFIDVAIIVPLPPRLRALEL